LTTSTTQAMSTTSTTQAMSTTSTTQATSGKKRHNDNSNNINKKQHNIVFLMMGLEQWSESSNRILFFC